MEDNYQRKNANMQTGNLRLSDSNHTKTPGMNSSAAIVLNMLSIKNITFELPFLLNDACLAE
jgi:hypothetical protein